MTRRLDEIVDSLRKYSEVGDVLRYFREREGGSMGVVAPLAPPNLGSTFLVACLRCGESVRRQDVYRICNIEPLCKSCYDDLGGLAHVHVRPLGRVISSTSVDATGPRAIALGGIKTGDV